MQFDDYIVNQSPPDFNYGELTVVPSSRYSSMLPWFIDQVSDQLSYQLNQEALLLNRPVVDIIDCTGNIGCDTILFRLLLPDADITVLENDEETFNALQENMNHLDRITSDPDVKEIEAININCLDYIYNNQTDVMYFDPPWGGTSYKNNKYINLYLSKNGVDYSIGTIINQVLKENPCLVILKSPYNFNYIQFVEEVSAGLHLDIQNVDIKAPSGKISYVLSFIRL